MSRKVKILFVAGIGRSGTTILDNVLGQLDGFFSGGEIRTIWSAAGDPNGPAPDRVAEQERSMTGAHGRWRCGCGSLVRDCEIWAPVCELAFGGIDRIDCQEMARLRCGTDRLRYIPLMLTPLWRQRMHDRLHRLTELISQLYRAITQVTGCRVIVDCSKAPSYAYILRMVPDFEVFVVHLIRDPRAVAFSLRKTRVRPDVDSPTEMFRMSTMQTSLQWIGQNIGSEILLGRQPGYVRLRYEDFVDHPIDAVGRMLELIGEPNGKLPFVSPHEVTLAPNHTVWGNPSRTRNGMIRLSQDLEWKTQLDRKTELAVSALTFPLLRRYGYRLLPERR